MTDNQPNLEFDNDHRFKVMRQSFVTPFAIRTRDDVLLWRAAWTQGLTSWHSPYKCLLDCNNLTVDPSDEVRGELDLMFKFLSGFFLRKVIGFSEETKPGLAALPFEVTASSSQGAALLGVRSPTETSVPQDFRASIQLQNHFQQHVVELSFACDCKIDDEDKIKTLKAKLMNNLMQWHSKWNLLIDCSQVEFSKEVHASFENMTTLFRGLHLKEVLGYGPSAGDKNGYPFTVYRSRHAAAGRLESEGSFSGSDANCSSRKASQT